MQRLNERTVMLDDNEMKAVQVFNDLLDVGYGINQAVDKIVQDSNLTLSIEFEAYLRS